jgi:hypothetical protein
MPLDRSHRLTDQTVAMNGPDDIGLVFAALERLPERGFFTKERAERDVAEEIGYQLVVHPDWVSAHVERLVRDHGDLGLTFDWQCVLMRGASPALLDLLLECHARDPDDSTTRWLLMASRAPQAMAVIADTARMHQATRKDLRDLGFHLPPTGPAEPRFVAERHALHYLPGSDSTSAEHAIGLPLDEVAASGEDAITFHYLSVTPSAVAGLPPWPGRAHLVSVRDFTGWVLWAAAEPDGRLRLVRHEHDDDHSLDDLNEMLDLATPQPTGAVTLLSFDDRLVYANQHVVMTPGVVGVMGGPPMGLAPTPDCVQCGRLMFHVAWVDLGSAYGDGYRSLFICEDCRISATLATLWN